MIMKKVMLDYLISAAVQDADNEAGEWAEDVTRLELIIARVCNVVEGIINNEITCERAAIAEAIGKLATPGSACESMCYANSVQIISARQKQIEIPLLVEGIP